MTADSILWRRLDLPGHDACRLLRRDGGWRIEGMAVFRQETAVACLAYAVDCDEEWRTRQGTVRGWMGSHALELRIVRTPEGAWKANDVPVPGVDDCLDLDLGFTPATNLLQIRRVALEVGEAADVPVTWLDVPAGILDKLEQRYERRGRDVYWYEAPRFGYSAPLSVDAAGFVTDYPTLWEAEPR